MHQIFPGQNTPLSAVPGHLDIDGVRRVALTERLTLPGRTSHVAAHLVDLPPGPPLADLLRTEPHTHAFDEINHLISDSPGGMTYLYEVDGRRFTVQAPATVYLPAGTVHRMEPSAGRGTFICTHLDTAKSEDEPARHSHWEAIARRWAEVGSPLRPAPADTAFVAAEAADWARTHGRAPRVLLLGVTPELLHLTWPEGTTVRAADRSRDMIRAVWQGKPEQVACADWLALDTLMRPESFDLVLCDGGLHLQDYPVGQRRLAEVIGRLLAPEGRAVLRLFLPPAQKETSKGVLTALAAGQISDMNRLKLRLGMSLQKSPTTGVALSEVFRRLHSAEPDLAALAQRRGWTVPHATAIESYRDSADSYYFVTQDEAVALFRDTGKFRLLRTLTPAYADGERFPTVVFERAKT